MLRNRIPIHTPITVGRMSMLMCNFSLHEFEMHEGTVMVHPSVLVSLEQMRYDLGEQHGEEVCVRITGSTRSETYNEILGESLGWIDQGGVVSRVSRHLTRYGGIAVDFTAYRKKSGRRVAQKTVAEIAARYFDYVKGDYKDGHIHADNRNQKP